MSKSSDTTGEGKYKFLAAKVLSDSRKGARAKVAISIDDEAKESEGRGVGPIDALYDAVLKIVDFGGKLSEYNAKAFIEDDKAEGVVDIAWEDESGKLRYGQGSDVDIIAASGIALLDVLNSADREESCDRERNRQSFVETLIKTNK